MDKQHVAGAWTLAAGGSTLLRPSRCGYLGAKSDGLRVNGAALQVGEPLRVWSAERVLLVNGSERHRAFFTWDYCAQQSRAKERSYGN
jgi:hypothetical protein